MRLRPFGHNRDLGRPAPDALILPTETGHPWREYDWRNWRAEQLGHSPTMTLETYAHVIAEFRGAGAIDPETVIRGTRDAAEAIDDGVTRGPQEDLRARDTRRSAWQPLGTSAPTGAACRSRSA